MRQYIKLFLLMFASMFLTQCAAPIQNTSKTLRIVEYNGYIERDSLESLIKWNLEHKKETVLIFGAHWCGACQNLKILSEEAGVNLEHVKFVDIDDPWVASIAADIGLVQIPALVHFNVAGGVKHVRLGQYKVLVYLLRHFR